MKHLKKRWKVIAYMTGFVLLTFSPFEKAFMAYGLAGFGWLVAHIVRNRDPNYRADTGINAPLLDSRNPNESYYRY